MENFYSRTIFITCSLRMFFFNFIFSSSQYFFQTFTFPQILFIHTSRHIYSSLPFQSLRYSHKIVILVKLITYTFLFFIYSGYSYTFCHFVFPEHFQLSIWIFNHSILWIIQKTRSMHKPFAKLNNFTRAFSLKVQSEAHVDLVIFR